MRFTTLKTLVLWAMYELVVSFCVQGARAEYILTGPLSYHVNSAVTGASGVTILPAIENSTHPVGLLFYTSRDPIPAQLFHPSKLTAQRSESVFLEYSKQSRSYTSLTLPGGFRAAVTGNFSMRLGTLRVSVSTQGNQLPYVSVVHESEDPSVLGILGNEVVVSTRGRRSESWLDAGLRRNRETFEIRGQEIFLEGAKYEEQRIGLPNQTSQESGCLNQGAVAVNVSLFNEFLKGTMPGELKRRIESAKSGAPNDIIARYTILNVLPSGVVALDGYGKPVIISQEKERLANGEIIVCTISDLPA